MSKISEVEKELSNWRKSKKGCRGGKLTPEHIRKQVIELLTDYSPLEIQKRLGITINMLKNWQENASPEGIFIHLPSEAEKHKIITPLKRPLIPSTKLTSTNVSRFSEIPVSNLSLKISNGNWSMEGVLSLQDWHSAIKLLEEVK